MFHGELTLTFSSIAALLGTMVILAALPSLSVLTVSIRSATAGFMHGALTTLGIVVGDIIFILIAIYGLSVLMVALDDLFVIIKYLGGVYLIGLGITLWWTQPSVIKPNKTITISWLSSFLVGLLITLGDLKAILFYLSFFPAFVELSTISIIDVSIIITITIIAVGGVKLGYAAMADKASLLLTDANIKTKIHFLAGSLMLGIGIFLIINA